MRVVIWSLIPNHVDLIANFVEATTFRNNRRKIRPAIYNHARLRERPIPDILDGIDEENANGDVFIEGNACAVEEIAVVGNADEENNNEDFVEEQNEGLDPLEEDLVPYCDVRHSDENDIAVKQEMDPIVITNDQEAELHRLLEDEADNENIESSDLVEDILDNGNLSDLDEDAVEWIDLPEHHGFPMPQKCTDDAFALPKQENDRLSGNLAFAVKVSIHKFQSPYDYWIQLYNNISFAEKRQPNL